MTRTMVAGMDDFWRTRSWLDLRAMRAMRAAAIAASVNCGYTSSGLPSGLQIVGHRFDDLGMLRVARAWEPMRPAQKPWPTPPR